MAQIELIEEAVATMQSIVETVHDASVLRYVDYNNTGDEFDRGRCVQASELDRDVMQLVNEYLNKIVDSGLLSK